MHKGKIIHEAYCCLIEDNQHCYNVTRGRLSSVILRKHQQSGRKGGETEEPFQKKKLHSPSIIVPRRRDRQGRTYRDAAFWDVTCGANEAGEDGASRGVDIYSANCGGGVCVNMNAVKAESGD